MPITGVGIQSHVGHDRHVGNRLLELANGPRNQAVLVEAFSPVFGLQPFRDLREEHDTTNAQIPGALHLSGELFQAPAKSSWHGPDGLHIRAFMHEQGINEIRRLQLVFAHHGPQGRGAAQTTRAVSELHSGALNCAGDRNGCFRDEPTAASCAGDPSNVFAGVEAGAPAPDHSTAQATAG